MVKNWQTSSKNLLRYDQLNEDISPYIFFVCNFTFRSAQAQIIENVRQYLYIQQLISQPSSLGQFSSHFHHNSYFLDYFLAVIMKSGNSREMFFVTSHFSTLLFIMLFIHIVHVYNVYDVIPVVPSSYIVRITEPSEDRPASTSETAIMFLRPNLWKKNKISSQIDFEMRFICEQNVYGYLTQSVFNICRQF